MLYTTQKEIIGLPQISSWVSNFGSICGTLQLYVCRSTSIMIVYLQMTPPPYPYILWPKRIFTKMVYDLYTMPPFENRKFQNENP